MESKKGVLTPITGRDLKVINIPHLDQYSSTVPPLNLERQVSTQLHSGDRKPIAMK